MAFLQAKRLTFAIAKKRKGFLIFHFGSFSLLTLLSFVCKGSFSYHFSSLILTLRQPRQEKKWSSILVSLMGVVVCLQG